MQYSHRLRINCTEYDPLWNALNIYISGCQDHPCKGCFNPELWTFENGILLSDAMPELEKKIRLTEVKSCFLYGGEPLDSSISEVTTLCRFLKFFGQTIYLFTHYDFAHVQLLSTPPFNFLEYVTYLKCGEYDETLRTSDNIQFGLRLASSNQKIYKLK